MIHGSNITLRQLSFLLAKISYPFTPSDSDIRWVIIDLKGYLFCWINGMIVGIIALAGQRPETYVKFLS